MGKSHKKVKSDRINALRKQYEAFLEEDKKRKERNEYILGKLYNMRSCSTAAAAVVPQPRSKPFIEAQNTYDRLAIPERALRYSIPFFRPNEKSEDPTVLRDIVQKYILIPKRIPSERDLPCDNYAANLVENRNQNDNNDWQSKYDILKQLKKNEKEEVTDLTPKDKQLLSHAPPTLLNNERLYSGSNAYIKQSVPVEEEYEPPERDLSQNNTDNYSKTPKVQLEHEIFLNQTKVADHSNVESTEVDTGPVKYKMFSELQNPNTELCGTKPVEKEESFVVKDDNNEKTYLKNVQSHLNAAEKLHENIENINIKNEHENHIQPTMNEKHEVVEDKDAYENNEKTAQPLNADDWNPIEVNTPNVVANETYNEAPEQDVHNNKNEYPIDVINVKDFTPYDHVQLQDGQNINPEEFLDIPHLNASAPFDSQAVPETNQANDSDNLPIEITGNEELEEEQKMFYEEPAIQNAVQEESGDISNTEYPQNMNDQYKYYEGEGVQPEVAPVEVNEYEETSSRYDQNYEQQYGNTYDDQRYVQQPGTEQNPQNYEQYPQGYEQNPQTYEQHPEGYVQQPEGYVQHPEGYVQNPEEYQQHPEGYVQNPEEYQQHPEVSEQYPQGYEQNSEGYEQYQEGYEQPQGYAQHPDQEGYDQQYQQQNYEAPEQIEQQLDNEEGYVEKQEVFEEKPDLQEKMEAQLVGPK